MSLLWILLLYAVTLCNAAVWRAFQLIFHIFQRNHSSNAYDELVIIRQHTFPKHYFCDVTARVNTQSNMCIQSNCVTIGWSGQFPMHWVSSRDVCIAPKNYDASYKRGFIMIRESGVLRGVKNNNTFCLFIIND